MSPAANVAVEQKGSILAFIPEKAETGLIFYPGGKVKYLPDFYIPSLDRWFEIKGKPLSEAEIKKCEEFCRRLDNENIKFSVLIGSPDTCAVRAGEFLESGNMYGNGLQRDIQTIIVWKHRRN